MDTVPDWCERAWCHSYSRGFPSDVGCFYSIQAINPTGENDIEYKAIDDPWLSARSSASMRSRWKIIQRLAVDAGKGDSLKGTSLPHFSQISVFGPDG